MTPGQVFPPLTLRAESLETGRGGAVLAGPLDLAVVGGQCLLLRGPNGTGKTTLLLTLGGIITPLAGRVVIEGADEDARVLHYCGHRNATKARLTVRENLGFWRDVNGATGVDCETALEQVGLGTLGALDAGYLSAGQGRRLALARLLVSLRPIWLLDEPTAALDAQGHGLVTQLLARHLAMGGLAIAATHDPIALPDPSQLTTLTLGASA